MVYRISPVSAAVADHTFPKKANYYLPWDLTDQQARELSKWDVVILDMEIQARRPDLLVKLREWNPDIVLLVYITSQEVVSSYGSSASIMRRRWGKSIDDSWYLHNNAGKRLSWWNGTYLLNVTQRAPFVNGERFNDHLVDFVVNELLGSGYWNGVFYDNTWDNITHFAGTNIDYDGNGIIDPTIDASWREGMSYIYEQTRNKAPKGTIVVGNGITREYRDQLNGRLLENVAPSAWSATMNTYQYNYDGGYRPQVSIYNVNTGNKGGDSRYQDVRFGLTSALLEDGYFSYDFGDKDHGQLWWYDEYDVDLGKAISPAVSDSGLSNYAPDIWRRDFENGLAIVNSTDKAQRVDLNGEYEKIHGVQDTSVNDGSIVSETTVNADDGVVLLKTFSTLNNIVFNNGAFARFFRPDGSRVRNGFFVFEDSYKGGNKIAHVDVDGNGKLDLIVVSKNKLTVWRDDGQIYMKKYPYTTRYDGEIQVAIGDISGDGQAEIIVAPGDGYPMPIKVYSYQGTKVRRDVYPFGQTYMGGYSLALGNVLGASPQEIIIGTGKGVASQISVFGDGFSLRERWPVYESSFLGGVSVAAGNIDGQGYDEIVVGAGTGKKPEIRVYDSIGTQLYDQFFAYTALNEPGIDVQVLDVDFDGKDDIVGLGTGVGF